MIRLLALYPATDRDALPSIRRAARGMRGTPGLVGLSVTRRLEPTGSVQIFGPAVELAFADAGTLHAAMQGQSFRSLVEAGKGGGVTLHAHEVEVVAPGFLGPAGDGTTDVHVADDQAEEPADDSPLSTQLSFPSARPAGDDGGDAAA